MTGKLRVPRSRGAAAGLLLVLLGAWGGLVAFIGPYFHYAYTPDSAWTFTTGRLWLEILPGVGTLIGGLILFVSRLRPVALFGAWLAAVSGAWFAVGNLLIPWWRQHGGPAMGSPTGGSVARLAEELGFFTGLGVVVVFVAAAALGRFTVHSARDAKALAADKTAAKAAKVKPASAPLPERDERVPARAAILRRVASIGKHGPGATGRQAADREQVEPADVGS